MRLGAVCLLLHGCHGAIGDSAPIDGPAAWEPPPVGEPLVCDGIDAPRHRLVHLSRAEYERTLSDLLGVETALTTGFPDDDTVVGFSAPVSVDRTLAQNYWRAAGEAAAIAASRLDVLVPCELDAEGCADRFVAEFGLRAFRRPLAEDEVADYVALYRETVGDGNDAATGFTTVVQAMLASPNYLYRVELPPDGIEVRALDDYEIASRLSYFLWGTMPDERLFDAASRGVLRDRDARAAEVDRMLGDERAREGLAEFADEWLELSKLDHFTFAEGVVPGVETEEQRAALRTRMREQAAAFVERVFFDGGTFDELLTSNTYAADDTLAPILGIAPPGTSRDVALADRAGLLTLPAMLAAHGGSFSGGTSPIKRGVWLLDRILCLPHPPPLPQLPDYCSAPCDGTCTEGFACEAGLCVASSADSCASDADCNPSGGTLSACHSSGRCIPNPAFCIPPRRDDQTTREWWDSFGGSCHGCHTQINGIGYGLESYDGVGRHRETERTAEGDEPIDDSGQILGDPEGRDGPFEGARGLAERMVETGIGQECLSRSWFVHAFGQVPDGHRGAMCTAQEIEEAFEASGYDLRALVRAIALSDGFVHSAPTEEEEP
jgi:hypothetical protein